MSKNVTRISLPQIKVDTIIGVYDYEKEQKQPLLISVCLDYNAAQACTTDDIKDAIDYAQLEQSIVDFVETHQFELIEKLAQELLHVIMSDQRIDQAYITIEKPQAVKYAQTVTVEMSQTR